MRRLPALPLNRNVPSRGVLELLARLAYQEEGFSAVDPLTTLAPLPASSLAVVVLNQGTEAI